MAILKTLGKVAAVGAAAAAAYALMVRPRISTWGATTEEVYAFLPGDELDPEPKSMSTRAITVAAPADKVWPWLAQIGCDRAGWYSYDRLDNSGLPSADRILPEFQDLKLGDTIPLTPGSGFGPPVVQLDPGRSFTIGGVMDTQQGFKPVEFGAPRPPAYWSSFWTFLVQPTGEGETRLIHRNRGGFAPTLSPGALLQLAVEPISFLMERRMMLNIKERAEKAARQELGA